MKGLQRNKVAIKRLAGIKKALKKKDNVLAHKPKLMKPCLINLITW